MQRLPAAESEENHLLHTIWTRLGVYYYSRSKFLWDSSLILSNKKIIPEYISFLVISFSGIILFVSEIFSILSRAYRGWRFIYLNWHFKNKWVWEKINGVDCLIFFLTEHNYLIKRSLVDLTLIKIFWYCIYRIHDC